jgi:hypothetical protein
MKVKIENPGLPGFQISKFNILHKIYFILLIIFSCSFSSQGSDAVKGRVFNAKNNETIPYAAILISETAKGVVADEEGNFDIKNVEPGFYKIRVSAVGYKTYFSESFRITTADGANLLIPMEEENINLGEVEVRPSYFRKKEESPVSLRTIGIDEIEKNPGGNRDISKVIQSYPGVSSSSAIRNDLIVRGGGPGENRYYIDGIEIPNLNHFATQGASGGPVGIINVDFIREVNFYSGAFPASRGNALSAVLEFNQREASEKFKFRGTLGATDLALAAEGPLTKRTAFMASVRRSYLKTWFKITGFPFLPSYNDFQFKIKTKINAKTELSFIGLGAFDEYTLNMNANKTEQQRFNVSFLPVNTQWNYTLGAVLKHFKLKGNDTYVLSQNRLNNSRTKYQDNIELPQNKILDYDSYELETKFRYEHNYNSSSDFKFNYGIDLQYCSYFNRDYKLIYANGAPMISNCNSTLEFARYAVFGQVTRSYFQKRVDLSFGLRTDGNSYSSNMNDPLDQISPRLSASLSLTPGTSLNFNIGQFAQLPSYTTLGYTEFSKELVNKINGLTYIHVNHLVAGIEFRPTDNTQVTVEGFFKRYANYPFSVTDSVSMASQGDDYGVCGDEEVTPTSKGNAYGVEVLGRVRKYKGITAIASFTFVRSEFTDLKGEFVPTAWDNRYLFTFTGTRNLKKNWDLGIKWRYIGGPPYTPWDKEKSALKVAWDAERMGYLDYSKFNKERLRAFHQLDIRVDKSWYYSKWSLMLYFDIQNAYNFKADSRDLLVRVEDAEGNPLTDPSNPNKYVLKTVESNLSTVIPTFGIMIEF